MYNRHHGLKEKRDLTQQELASILGHNFRGFSCESVLNTWSSCFWKARAALH